METNHNDITGENFYDKMYNTSSDNSEDSLSKKYFDNNDNSKKCSSSTESQTFTNNYNVYNFRSTSEDSITINEYPKSFITHDVIPATHVSEGPFEAIYKITKLHYASGYMILI